MEVSKGSNEKQQKKWRHHFLNYKSMVVFLSRLRTANSVVGGPIWPKFELIHNIMHVLVTSKFEKDRININGDYVMTSIFRRSRAATSKMCDVRTFVTHEYEIFFVHTYVTYENVTWPNLCYTQKYDMLKKSADTLRYVNM